MSNAIAPGAEDDGIGGYEEVSNRNKKPLNRGETSFIMSSVVED